jgi:hypothetical protein
MKFSILIHNNATPYQDAPSNDHQHINNNHYDARDTLRIMTHSLKDA